MAARAKFEPRIPTAAGRCPSCGLNTSDNSHGIKCLQLVYEQALLDAAQALTDTSQDVGATMIRRQLVIQVRQQMKADEPTNVPD